MSTSYQWEYNGKPIPGATGPTIVVEAPPLGGALSRLLASGWHTHRGRRARRAAFYERQRRLRRAGLRSLDQIGYRCIVTSEG